MKVWIKDIIKNKLKYNTFKNTNVKLIIIRYYFNQFCC